MGKAIRKRERSQNLRNAMTQLSDVSTRVGFFDSAKYPDGTPVASVAVVQEFGSTKRSIPPRPFMRTTEEREGENWTRHMGQASKAVADGRIGAVQAMDQIGLLAAGDIRKTIASIQSPPLADATVAARKRRYADKKTTGNLAKPLVDTAVMVNAVTHVVEVKGS